MTVRANFEFMLLLTLMALSCKKDENTQTVKYTIQGTSKTTITYVDAYGVTQTVTNADPSWTTSFASIHRGMLLRLTVVSEDSSPVGGKIYINGQQQTQDNGSSSSINITATLS